MPFQEILERVEAGDADRQCSVRVRRHKRGRPSLAVSVRKRLADELGWTNGQRVLVGVGDGADAGKLRLWLSRRDTEGVGVVRRMAATRSSGEADAGKSNGFSVDLGFVEALCAAPSGKTPCVGSMVVEGDVRYLEIVLPEKMEPEPADEPDDEIVDEDRQRPASVAAKPVSISARAAASEGEDDATATPPGCVQREGVTISVNPPFIQHDGNKMALQPLHQKILAALLPSMTTGPIPLNSLAMKTSTNSAAVQNALVDLQPLLGRVDLAVEKIGTIGFVLKKI
jgi:hypothetical protein